MGMTLIPMANGFGGISMIPLSIPSTDDRPTEYQSSFMTADDIQVDLVYHTDDQDRANQLESEISEKTGWTQLADENEPDTRFSVIVGTILIIAGIWITITVVGFLGFCFYDMVFNTRLTQEFLEVMLTKTSITAGVGMVLFATIEAIFFDFKNEKKSNV